MEWFLNVSWFAFSYLGKCSNIDDIGNIEIDNAIDNLHFNDYLQYILDM